MKLHQDKDAFRALLSGISQKVGIRGDIVEKDYYLTLLLWELAQKQEELPAYFKGGTALYKAIGCLKRFSEDIDLTVEVQDCTRTQGKKRLERAANGYTVLERTTEKERESNARGSITSVYVYTPVIEADQEDLLQRFGYVKVEATSFTISEPTESLEIAPLLYEKATEEQQAILKAQYSVGPFLIRTIKMERIFADKILAAEFYVQRNEMQDVAKHLYDIAVMMTQKRIQNLLKDPEAFVEMLAYKRREEKERKGSDLAKKPFSEFEIFGKIREKGKLEEALQKMQEIYVFSQEDILPYHVLAERMKNLEKILLSLDEKLGML